MKKPKHTPGPWKVAVGADAKVICPDGRAFNIGDALYHPENVVNARLIAAAPELLAALKAVVAISDRKHDAWDAAHAAIAKAEGRA